MDISICIITKNEKEKLNRCLDSLKNNRVEIVVVDTGSTDGTVSMLEDYVLCEKKCKLTIGHFEWINDFSAAKNYCVSLAENDLVMVIDSDEWLVNGNIDKIASSIKDRQRNVWRIKRINLYERDGEECENREYVSRIYDRRYFQYEGRIHEQIVRKNVNKEIELINLPLEFNHDGYSGTLEQIKEKTKRNIVLLKDTLEIEGESPYILYQLGKSYYMAGEYGKSVEYFDKALYYDVNPKFEYVIDMVETYGYALINSGQATKALNLEGVYDVFGNSADFKFMMGFVYMNNEMFEEAINQFLLATRCSEGKMKGTNSYLAFYNAGVIYECMGYTEKAVEMYKKCKDYRKAKNRLNEII